MGLIIFGVKNLASLAHFYLKDEVDVFTVDEQWCAQNEFEGKQVVSFEHIEMWFPPKKYRMFLPISDNKTRAIKAAEAKAKGYELSSYIHPSNLLYETLGENCFILENNIIQPYVKVGNNVILWTANHIGHHSTIGNNVFFASGVIVCGHCTIGDYAWLGANSTIRDGKTVGEGCIIGMNSAVVDDTESWSTYYGIPAKKKD